MTGILPGLILSLSLFLAPAAAHAAAAEVVFAQEQRETVAVRYLARADYIGRTVTITSGERDLKAKLRNILDAKRYVLEEAGRRGQVIAREGMSTLRPSKGSFRSDSGQEPAALVHILLPVVRESDNLFSGAMELADRMSGLEPPGKAEFSLSAVRLAVEDPEKARGIILERINRDIAFTRSRMKDPGKVAVTGLESPVRVSRFDDINVVLFIEYGMSLEVQ